MRRRAELGPLIDAADAQSISWRVRLGCGGVDRRAAFRAEGVGALGPALRGLDVDLRRPSRQPERLGQTRNAGPKRRAGQLLAIGAMAHPDGRRIDLGLVGDVPAMATS